MKLLGWCWCRVRWVAVFAFALLLCSGASVLAELPAAQESPSAREAPETTPLPPPLDGDHIPLPGAQDVAVGLAQSEAKEGQALEWLASPEAVHEREISQDSYADLSPAESEQLLSTQFPQRLEALNSDPARFLSGATLVHPAGESAAVVTAEGKTTLMDSTVPVQVRDEEGDLSKVDLSLQADESGSYEPANPIVDLNIPATAGEAVELGEDDLSITQAGADGESAARRFGDKNVFYPEVQQSTDLLVSPTSTGVELFDQLRSEDSPETLRFQLNLPAGATLVADEVGGAEVKLSGGPTLAHIPPPAAEDAQGTAVPVELQVEGDALVLRVPHREGEYAAPILVDPEFVFEDWSTANWYNGSGLSALSDGTWQWSSNVPWIYPSTTPIHDGFGGSERGLFVSTPNGAWGANNYGHWVYSVPDWTATSTTPRCCPTGAPTTAARTPSTVSPTITTACGTAASGFNSTPMTPASSATRTCRSGGRP
jgi:hypothetical protein